MKSNCKPLRKSPPHPTHRTWAYSWAIVLSRTFRARAIASQKTIWVPSLPIAPPGPRRLAHPTATRPTTPKNPNPTVPTMNLPPPRCGCGKETTPIWAVAIASQNRPGITIRERRGVERRGGTATKRKGKRPKMRSSPDLFNTVERGANWAKSPGCTASCSTTAILKTKNPAMSTRVP